MTEQAPPVFDFREIAALDDTAIMFRNWLSKSSSFFSDFWAEVSGYGAQLTPGQISTESYEKLLDAMSKEDFCCTGEIQGHLSTMWYASLDSLRLIVSELLCLKDADELSGEELSPVEGTLLQVSMDQIAQSLMDGWLGDETPTINTGLWTRDPKKTRLFRAKDLITKTSIQLDLNVGNAEIHWLLPKQSLAEMLETTIDQRDVRVPKSPKPEMVGQLPIEVVTVLGRLSIPMTKLSQLAVGQTIMLNQRIDQPVVATVNDSPFFECWPGKIGKKQALEISACLQR